MLRATLAAFAILVVLEGAIRKWLLPAYGTQVFVVKDLLLALACFAYVVHRPKNLPPAADLALWIGWALLALGYTAVAGFGLENVVGLRYYLAPLPLVVLIPALIRSSGDLERAATWAVRLAYPVGLLAVLQYFSPIDSPLNIYARGGEEAVTGFGSESDQLFSGLHRARVTATFSYIATFAAYLTAAWVLAWIAVLEGRTVLDRWLAGAALILIAFNMAMNGSRALFFVALLTGVPFAWLLLRRLGTIKAQLLGGGMVASVLYVGVEVFEPFGLTAMRGDPGETTERLVDALVTPYAVLAEVGFGTGIGTMFAGIQDLGVNVVGEGFNESLDRVGVELGVLGYVIYLGLKIYLLLKAFRAYRRAPAQALRHWALAALLVQLSAGWQIPFYNSVSAVVYFSAVGLVYWIEREGKRMRRPAAMRFAPPSLLHSWRS